MIPTNKEIHKKLSRDQIEYILLNDKKYFASVERFIELNEQFYSDNFLSKISIWIDMVISPLITLTQLIFFRKKIDIFTIMTAHKTISIWLKWFEWKEMQNNIREWIKIVRSIGGPFIGCNDASYHMYVYADGMQRIHDSLFGHHRVVRVSKERTKRL